MSQLFKLNLNDVGKAILVAFLTAFFGSVYAVLQTGKFPDLQELGAAAIAGLTAALGYLTKNLFTNSQNQLAKPEPKS